MEEKTTVKNENKKEDIKEQNKKEDDKVKKAESKKSDDIDEDEEDNDNLTTQELFNHRTSIALTPENAWFSKSAGGLTSLKIINDRNEEEFFDRVTIRRAFPFSCPDEFISVHQSDPKEKARNGEIGMIRNINIFDKETIDIINADLNTRYFIPELKKITYVKEKFGDLYCDVETSAGNMRIVIRNPYGRINTLPDGRVLISDLEGSHFIIPDIKTFDKRSYRYIEAYI
ncbi:MAG: DUF1854 domain-containing protein [Ruminococcaceae bacterium]|nr:DUF1854 domain-containing protein [Oscillospiraceae bacterium]